MTDFTDPNGAVVRLSNIADLLTLSDDAAIVRQYATELEHSQSAMAWADHCDDVQALDQSGIENSAGNLVLSRRHCRQDRI